mmetsp:Transcript_409/g.1396  ORF Transcript_409/g.1396 Transcript_409/m.1396 type:complete len:354 (+) Transcript_409:105-1166(+)
MGPFFRGGLIRRLSAAKAQKQFRVTLFPGDGIGPEISEAVVKILDAVKAPLVWEEHVISTKNVKPGQDLVSREALDSVLNNGWGLKGPMETPVGKGHKSLNLTLRKELGLYANVRPCKTVPGVKTLYENVNVVTVRENTEGEYSGLEHEVIPGVVESLKVITRDASMRVAEYAFNYATLNKRNTVTAVHKASVMKMSDGLFLSCCREVAEKHPNIKYEEMLIDNAASFLVSNPGRLDVMVMPNLYGDIVSDLCAGLIGGLGLTPSGNMGSGCMLAEAVHGTAPDIAGKDLANPTALLMSALMMLREMKLGHMADKIETSVHSVLKEGKYKTRDIGGSASCSDYTQAVIDNIAH